MSLPPPTSTSDSILTGKIQVILQESPEQAVPEAPHANERYLVALVLLTRVHDADLYVTFWESHPKLVTFCNGLLQDSRGNNDNAGESLELYSRLVAQLVDRMPPSRLSTTVQELSQALLIVLDRRREQKISLGAADVEITRSLNVWFEILEDRSIADGVLTSVWERYSGLMKNGTKSTDETKATSTDDATTVKVKVDDLQSAHGIMIRTLTKLLDDGVDPSHHQQDKDLWRIWQCENIALFLQQGMRVAEEKVPSFWIPALRWWLESNPGSKKNAETSSPRISLENRRSWAEILLLCARNTALLPSFQTQLAEDTTLAKDLTRLILTCVVSNEGSDRLRSSAWSTSATLVQSCGWEWLLGAAATTQSQDDAAKKSGLGHAASLCTFVRLAIGEWKIQLGLLVAETCTSSTPSEERLLLVQACAQVIVQAVQFVVQLADRMDQAADDETESLPLSGDALIHLRQSLDEALNLAVQYLGLAEQRVLSVDGPVVRVLGTLLTEFDVFEHQISTKEQEGNEILQALRVALDIHDLECQEDLLPCLALVLSSSEGDEAKVAMLEEYQLLGEPLVNFLEAYWKHASNLSSIEYAYKVVATWSSMARISDTSGLLGCVIGWIERHINHQSLPKSSELIGALSTAIACYVTLQGEEHPGEPDATILQCALDVCARNVADLS
jgi:hypothetical protein